MKDRIKKIRKEFDLTQQEFADKLGVARNNIAGYETGKRSPSAASISLICKTFNISEEWLRTGKGLMKVEPSSFSLDDYIRKNGGTPEDFEVVKAYFSLPKDVRKLIFNRFRCVFAKPSCDASRTVEELGCLSAENNKTG